MEKLESIKEYLEPNKEEKKEKEIDTLLIPQQRPMMVDVDKAVHDWQIYQKLTQELLDPSDYQTIRGRAFKKKSAWRKYTRAFNISHTIIDKEINRNKKGIVTEASFIVRAISPDGRYCEGWGNCSKFERKFTKPNHDIPATAMTRATSRAISDLIGAGEVTAEEIIAQNTSSNLEIIQEKEKEIYTPKKK